MWNGAIIVVKEGQLITGRRALSEQTGIPGTTVERILDFLENEHQIGQQKTNKYRLITIVNWDKYQNPDSISDNKRTTNGHKQECKELKEDTETREKISLVGPTSEEAEIPTFEEYLEELGVTTDYESWGDDGISELTYRLEGKKVPIKKLLSMYEKVYPPTPSVRPRKALRDEFAYDFDRWVMKLKNSSSKADKIIAFVWTERGYRFDNYEQWKARFGQDIKYARQLEGYKPNQVKEVIDLLNIEERELNYKWSMSTIAKKIANVVST
jgi:hypothetical protein